jgi:hypothetical protein
MAGCLLNYSVASGSNVGARLCPHLEVHVSGRRIADLNEAVSAD